MFIYKTPLKKAEREQLLDAVRAARNEKIITLKDKKDLDFAWQLLAWDHCKKLRLNLSHIGDIPLCDAVGADTVEQDSIPTKGYFQHYNEKELEMIATEVRRAQQACAYLERLIIEERARRGG